MRFTLMLTAVALSTAASAARDLSRPAVSPACRTELRALCPISGDKTARHLCLREKRASISDGCKADIAKVKQERRARRADGAATPAPTTGNTMSPQ